MCLPAPSSVEPKEREFVVDSGESMQMLSGKNLNSAVRVSRNPTTVLIANGEVQTNLEATDSCQGFGFRRDSTAPRRYAASSIAWKAAGK